MVSAPNPFLEDNGEAAANVQVNPAASTTPDEQPPSARRRTGSTRDAALYRANRAKDTQSPPAIIGVPRRSGREATAINPIYVLDGGEDTTVPSTAREEDPSPVLNKHFEDQIAAEDAAHLDLQDEAGTPDMDTVQPSTVLEYHDSTGKEADQSAMDGAEPSANRKIFQIFKMVLNAPAPSQE